MRRTTTTTGARRLRRSKGWLTDAEGELLFRLAGRLSARRCRRRNRLVEGQVDRVARLRRASVGRHAGLRHRSARESLEDPGATTLDDLKRNLARSGVRAWSCRSSRLHDAAATFERARRRLRGRQPPGGGRRRSRRLVSEARRRRRPRPPRRPGRELGRPARRSGRSSGSRPTGRAPHWFGPSAGGGREKPTAKRSRGPPRPGLLASGFTKTGPGGRPPPRGVSFRLTPSGPPTKKGKRLG